MAKEGVLSTLQETLQEISAQLSHVELCEQSYQRAVTEKQEQVRLAQGQEACAVYEDEKIKAKKQELLSL